MVELVVGAICYISMCTLTNKGLRSLLLTFDAVPIRDRAAYAIIRSLR